MKLKSIALICLLSTNNITLASAKQFSGINHVSFKDSTYDNQFAGNGFLINYKDNLYAVTVKHTLFEAKTPNLTSVYLRDELKEWRIHPNQNKHQYITLGRLINADKNEPIDMKILSKDWLVFEVKDNVSNLIPLQLRETSIKVGESLTAYGCSYADKQTCTQNQYQGKFIGMEPDNLRIEIGDLDLNQFRGLSGSPVLDNDGKLVGIVSNVLKKQSGEGFDFAPASLDYLRQVLDTVNK